MYYKSTLCKYTWQKRGNIQSFFYFSQLMGCKRLDTDFFNFLEVVHRQKGDRGEKKRLNVYPFGLEHKGYNNVINGTENNYQTFQGQELEEELGKNTLAYQWRDYDPAIARFGKIDRFAEKYADNSPYNFTANNPIFYREIKGDSIDVSAIVAYDKTNGTSILNNIKNDLSKVTGLSFSVSNGKLVYTKDSNGNAIVATDSKGNQTGSAEARKMLTHSLDDSNIAYTEVSSTGESFVGDSSGNPLVGGDHIFLDPKQIDGFINGAVNVDNKTLGYGMVFLHETLHTNVAEGGAKGDPSGGNNFSVEQGPVVTRMNKVRRELNNQGGNYGERSTYSPKAYSVNGVVKQTILFKGRLNRLHPRPLSGSLGGGFLGPRVEF